jgi:AbrB family looped-hinge helix DNA binding protein
MEAAMGTAIGYAKLSSKGQITLPKAARNAAHLENGDPVKVEVTDEGILLRPQKMVDAKSALLEQRTFLLDDNERDEFLSLLERQPSVRPNLRRLVERGSVLPR